MSELPPPSELMHDWNHGGAGYPPRERAIEFDDETLRDGLQSPSVQDPPLEVKIRLLHLMEALGIHSIDVGLPGAGPRALADITAVCALEFGKVSNVRISEDRHRNLARWYGEIKARPSYKA